MSRTITRTAIAFVVAALCFTTGAIAGSGTFAGLVPAGFRDSVVTPNQGQDPAVRPFKLKGGGSIDISTLVLQFGGTATHLGQVSGTGQVDPATLQIQGTMTAANGDTIEWIAGFQPGPLGEIEATFTFTGGTGRFTNVSGSATGPVALDPDFMFTINLQGTIAY